MNPGGVIRYFQTLDVAIKKSFKDELKKYTKYCMDQQDIKARVTQKELTIELQKFDMVTIVF